MIAEVERAQTLHHKTNQTLRRKTIHIYTAAKTT